MARGRAAGGSGAPRAQIALVVLGALGLAVLYWQFVHGPRSEDKIRLSASLRTLQKENQTLGQEERIQNDMIRCKPELDAMNRENELMLPSEAEPVAFLKNLSSMAATAGLEQGATRMMAEADVQAPAAPAEEKRRAPETQAGLAGGGPVPCWEEVPGVQADAAGQATFARVPFVIEVRGTFHQLMRYFWMLHEHAGAGRIISVEDLSLTHPEPGPDGIVMTAKFTAVGFREPSDAAQRGADRIARPEGP